MKKPGKEYSSYLIDVLKQEVLSRETEINAIRSSLRYRVGGWALEAWPPSRRTLLIGIRTLVALIRVKRHKRKGKGRGAAPCDTLTPSTESTDTVVFGARVPDIFMGGNTFRTDDPHALSSLLDTRRCAGTLVLRQVDQAVTRRVQRLQLNGWYIVWWPEECDGRDESPQGVYLAAHSDEYRVS